MIVLQVCTNIFYLPDALDGHSAHFPVIYKSFLTRICSFLYIVRKNPDDVRMKSLEVISKKGGKSSSPNFA